jgi:hypothetical protein
MIKFIDLIYALLLILNFLKKKEGVMFDPVPVAAQNLVTAFNRLFTSSTAKKAIHHRFPATESCRSCT